MRQTREILRHKWILDASHRRTVEALGVSHGTVTQTVQRALRAGLSWSAVCVLNDAELEELLQERLDYLRSRRGQEKIGA